MNKDIRKSRISRRTFVAGAAAGSAALAAGAAGFPSVLRAQASSVKIGLVHPVTGFLQFSGSQCRFGGQTAIEPMIV